MSDVNVFLLVGKLIIFSAANLPFFWLGYCEFKIRYRYSVVIAAFICFILPLLIIDIKGLSGGALAIFCDPLAYCYFDMNYMLMPVAQFFIGIFLHFQRKTLAALTKPKRYTVLAFEWAVLSLVASFVITLLPFNEVDEYVKIYESYPLTAYVDYVGKMFRWP